MKTKELCPHCGQPMREYKVRISKMMINALVKFRKAVIYHNVNRIHILNDMENRDFELTRHEWNNFTRLRFHALAVKVKGDPGYWLMTKRGADFLNGKIEIPREVWIRNNQVVEHSEEKVNIKDVVGSSVYVEKLEDIVYRSFDPEQKNLFGN